MKWETKLVPQAKKEFVEYVYPNLVTLPQRGNLLERWNLAIKEGCDYIEIAADFIKNKTEMDKTGRELGEMLAKDDIDILYQKDGELPEGVEYILHTDPAIPRRDNDGTFFIPSLRWEDPDWVEALTRMLIEIQNHIGIPAAIIEIHSGPRNTSLQSIVAAVKYIHEKSYQASGKEGLVLIENKVGQAVSNAENIAMLWRMLIDNGLEDKSGIMLDVPNLHKSTGKKFKSSLEAIPNDSVKGMHVHWKHRAPTENDPVDWDAVFDKVIEFDHQVLINPEVFHASEVPNTITFCEHILGRWQRVKRD